jgi:exopolyphosphatase/pppGpp-phosphohydrolase
MCSLAKGTDAEHPALRSEGIEILFKALPEWRRLLDSYNIRNVFAYATGAVRNLLKYDSEACTNFSEAVQSR